MYLCVQVVDEIYDTHAARRMGIDRVGQVCVMIHRYVHSPRTYVSYIIMICVAMWFVSGSRGLGHQVATDALIQMESAMR